MTLADLHSQCYAELCAYARRHGVAASDIEDVVQTAFLQALGGVYTEQGAGRAWLYRVVASRSIDWRRKQQRERTVPLFEAHEPSYDPTPAVLARLDVLGLLPTLPALQRQVVWLHLGEGLSLEETAARMGRTVGAVKSLCHRARVRLVG